MSQVKDVLEEIASSINDVTDRVWQLEAARTVPGSGAAPADVDYFVGTADAVLTNEIVLTYARGSIIRGGAAAWEVLAIGAANTHLESDGTDVTWEVNLSLADAAWIGNSGASARLAFDSSGTDYALFSDCNVGVGTAPGDHHFRVQTTITSDNEVHGIYNSHTRTGGATDVNDDFYNIFNDVEYNHNGGQVGQFYSFYNLLRLTDGSVGTAGTNKSAGAILSITDIDGGTINGFLYGQYSYIAQAGGTITKDMRTIQSYAKLDGGTITEDFRGMYVGVDQNVGHTINDDVTLMHLWADLDGTVTGNAYMLYIDDSRTGIDYCIYQVGSRPSRFMGKMGIGRDVSSTAKVRIYDDTAFTSASAGEGGLYIEDSAGTPADGAYGVGVCFGKVGGGSNRQHAAIIPVQNGADSDNVGLTFWGHGNTAADPIVEHMRITGVGNVFIGDTSNTFATLGLTINQGANDDEIIAIKSSDVAHGMTTLAETDTYGVIRKEDSTDGGLLLIGYRDATADAASVLAGRSAVAADTTKSTAGRAVVETISQVKSGTTVTTVGADGNLFAIRNHSTTRFIFDAEGTGHADDSWTTFSDDRLKTDQEKLSYGLAEVMQLQPKSFVRYSGHYDNDELILENARQRIGLIAQDVLKIIPEAVRTPPDTSKSFYSLDYNSIIPVLVRAIQELAEKNDV